MIYYDEGNQKEAMKWYLKAIEKNNLNAKINLGVFYAELEDNTKALEWLKKALGEAKKNKRCRNDKRYTGIYQRN